MAWFGVGLMLGTNMGVKTAGLKINVSCVVVKPMFYAGLVICKNYFVVTITSGAGYFCAHIKVYDSVLVEPHDNYISHVHRAAHHL